MLKMFVLSFLPILLFVSKVADVFFSCRLKVVLFDIVFHFIIFSISSVMNVQRCAIFATIVFGVRAEAFQKLCQVGRNGESTTAPFLKQLQGIFFLSAK